MMSSCALKLSIRNALVNGNNLDLLVLESITEDDAADTTCALSPPNQSAITELFQVFVRTAARHRRSTQRRMVVKPRNEQ